MQPITIALVGDYSPEVVAHRAIPHGLELIRAEISADTLAWHWVATREIRDASRDLADFSAVWVVPASPYENMAGALDAIRFARETRRPFLGTCGGFQHALIEYARNVGGVTEGDHAEINPNGKSQIVTPLRCSLVGKDGPVHFTPGSGIHRAYGRNTAHESYHCNYGLNPAYRGILENCGLRFTAFDENGEVRAAELPATVHPFFIGTLFQPERAALRGEIPPLVRAFVATAISPPAG